MKRTAIICATVALSASCATGFAQPRSVGDVRVVGPLSGLPASPASGVWVSDRRSTEPFPVGEPFFVKNISPGVRGGDVAIAGTSSQPMQPAVDPRTRDAGRRLVWSACPGIEQRGTPRCSLRQMIASDLAPTPIGDTPGDQADRLPSVYDGNVAFVRERGRGFDDQLRWLPAGQSRSTALKSGPRGAAESEGGPTGLALRERTLAYVWGWRPRPGLANTRYTLQTQTVGAKPKTIVSIPTSKGRIIGPVWDDSKLLFVVRTATSAALYRYTPSSRRFERTTAPSRAAAFGADAGSIYWTIAATAPRAGEILCGASCSVTSTARGKLTFKRATKPR